MNLLTSTCSLQCLPNTHLVLLPQLLHVSLLPADLSLSLGAALLRSVELQALLGVALGQSGQLSLKGLALGPAETDS